MGLSPRCLLATHIVVRGTIVGMTWGKSAYLATRREDILCHSEHNMTRTSLVTAVFLSLSLGMGCHLYVDGDERDPDLREPRPDPVEPCSAPGCEPPAWTPDAGNIDGGIGDQCRLDIQCGPGCYCTPDGFCEESSTRPDATIFACSDQNSEVLCDGNDACAPVFRGINCTAENGSSCTSSSAGCKCESFAFDRCEDA